MSEMLLTATAPQWSTLINFIVRQYFVNSFATCILWHDRVHFQLADFEAQQFVQIHRKHLPDSFATDVYNFTAKAEEKFLANNLDFDELVLKLTVAIEQAHCEDDIPQFARAFRNASIFSLWRSLRTKFLFAYRKDLMEAEIGFFEDQLFKDQPNILIIEAETGNSSLFTLKTNRFVGSMFAQPEELYVLNCYDALEGVFATPDSLYPDKITDLHGREVIIGAFEYKPYVVIDYERSPQIYDHAEDNLNHSVYVDGTDARLIYSFCALYNCTVQIDTTEKYEWGSVHENGTGDGIIGMITNGKAHYIIGGIYPWYLEYCFLDLTVRLSSSTVTCMVPTPIRLTSWSLPMKPFRFTLWLGIFMCLALEALSLAVARKMEKSAVAGTETWLSSWRFGYTTALKLFVSQGTDYAVGSLSLRTVLCSCYMIDIIVTSIYSGGLAAILTTPKVAEAADSLMRLYTHKLIWSATSPDWAVSLQNENDDPIIKTIVGQFRVHTWDELRELAKTENMGFVIELLTFGHSANGDFLTDAAMDRLKLMVDELYSSLTIAYVPRLWPCLAKFNRLVNNWHAAGLGKYWEWKVTAEHLDIQVQNRIMASRTMHYHGGPVQLDMVNFAGLMLVWLVGVTGSVLVFIVEYLCCAAQRHQ